MSKYEPLATHLRTLQEDHVRLTFMEIESILGSILPESARQHRRWWSNSNTDDSHTWAHEWMEAGWEKDQLDLQNQQVSFRRVAKPRALAERAYLADLTLDGLDATFALETWGGSTRLYLESRGPKRNTDYLPALDRVLERLATLDATLLDVLVESQSVTDLPAERRRVRLSEPYPIALGRLHDVEVFRRSLTRAVAATARAKSSSGGGNPTKRLRLELVVPGQPDAYDLSESLTARGKAQAPPRPRFRFTPRPPVSAAAPSERSGTDATVVARKHVEIQQALYSALVAQHGAASVSAELTMASGRPADLVVESDGGFIIYEIKTAGAAKDCVRQALGQLFEYAFWPGSPSIERLVVVGTAKQDAFTRAFLAGLNERFGLPIAYESVDGSGQPPSITDTARD